MVGISLIKSETGTIYFSIDTTLPNPSLNQRLAKKAQLFSLHLISVNVFLYMVAGTAGIPPDMIVESKLS